MMNLSRTLYAASLAALLVVGVFVAVDGSSHRRLKGGLKSVERLDVTSAPSNNHLLDNVSYSQLRGAIVERYFASHDDVTNKDKQLGDALKAMKMVEKDGEPVPIDGMDGLYVGSIGAALNLEALQDEGITHIVSLTDSAPCKWPDQFDCLHIEGVKDKSDPENSIAQYFDKTLPFIDQALAKGGRVLVHCKHGKSRSVSTIAAYLIARNHVSPEEALEQIRVNRPKAKPNKGYMQDLEDFYEEQVIERSKQVISDDP
ncbi:MAG: hypothetical protein SGARI_006447 [Bacillariaceae sp.]